MCELLTGPGGSTAKIRELRIGSDGGVAAGDIEPNTGHRHRVLVSRYPTDRHYVAHVPICHQRNFARVPCDLGQLRTRVLFVRSKDSHG